MKKRITSSDKKISKKIRDDFKDILKLSEISLKKLWDNEEDEIWNNI
ncbi:MAG: hypothetical protein AABW50_04320 [Nanoarchaeota archaeon]